MNRCFLLLLGASLSFLLACDSQKLYEFNYEMDQDTWVREDTLGFLFSVEDTTTHYNLLINVRNTSEYAYRNLYLFLTISSPDGNFAKDTVECVLADKDGRWLGKGGAHLFDNQIVYKKNIRFPRPGDYRVIFEQAMREPAVYNIRNMGFRVEEPEARTDA